MYGKLHTQIPSNSVTICKSYVRIRVKLVPQPLNIPVNHWCKEGVCMRSLVHYTNYDQVSSRSIIYVLSVTSDGYQYFLHWEQ